MRLIFYTRRMKRFIRVLSFLAGVAAIIWAMRDRFISLALPREPQPPAFRHPAEHPHVPHQPHADVPTPSTATAAKPAEELAADDLEEINGIGPVFARKLADRGITTFAQLAAASAADLADAIDTYPTRVQGWIDQAGERTA